MRITIDAELQSTVMVGVIRLSKMVLPEDNGDAIWQKITLLAEEISEKYRGVTIGQVPKIAHARILYRSIGIDPTKTRPSSEALLRRLLKGRPLYRVHPIVDLLNYVSLEKLIPVGLYDETKIAGSEISVRLGRSGEGYDGIRKDRVNVENRLCVADELGPFGSPTSDSLRTSLAGEVPNAVAVFFQHVSVPKDGLEQALDLTESLTERYLGATAVLKTVLGGI